MSLDILTLTMVFFGAVLLAASLRPVRALYHDGHEAGRSWRGLLFLIIFFITGYIGYAWLLIGRSASLIDLIVAVVFLGGGGFVLMVVRLSSASIDHIRRLAAQEKINAMHDDLTGLANRALFRAEVASATVMALRENARLAVFVMDLDRFKEVNDTLGHYQGDILLKLVAPRLRAAAGPEAMVARLGGDEFALLCRVESEDKLAQLAQRIIQHIERSFQIGDHEITVGVSIGIAIAPEHGDTSELLLQRADVAMYQAKHRNSGFTIYDAEQDPHSLARLALAGQLRNAIGNNELAIHYQPQLDLRNRRVQGVEALVRWNHPQRGLLPPAEFLPLAEQTGLIKALAHWVFDTVLHQAVLWNRSGVELAVSMNLSAKDLQDPRFVQHMLNALSAAQLTPGKLVFELVENAIMADIQPAIQKLSKLGVRFAIDDFGTGYSSLSYLKTLPVSEIKIDQSFVMDMTENDNDAVIVRAIIDLAHNMGYQVVAEGVQDQDTLDILEILGCDAAQGHHISQALTKVALGEWLALHTARPETRPA